MLERLSAECAPPSAASSSESALAEVLDEIAARLQRGEQVDVECYVADHPQWVEPLRRILPTLEALVVAGRKEGSGFRVRSSEKQDSEGPTTALTPALSQREREQDSNPKSKIENPKCLGDFKLLREIGRGGMGVVYEATQVSLGRRVAVKVLPQAGMLDPRHLQRFQNEARAAAQLSHPHIVDVICVGCDDGVHYFAMRFVDGQTLAEAIAEFRCCDGTGNRGQGTAGGSQESEVQSQNEQTGPPDPLIYRRPHAPHEVNHHAEHDAYGANPKSKIQNPKCAEWLAQAAEALDHAHSVGVVHRDIKPSNLLVDREGNLWVTDFGLARFGDEAGLTMTGDLLGTLRYMSPEQALGQRAAIDHRSDIYALGATLYELLALRPVFEGADRSDLLRQIAFVEPRPLRKLDSRIPRDLETITLKALEKSPADRYATPGEMAADLRRFLRGEPIHAKPPTLAQRTFKWCLRHRGLVAAAAAVLVLAVVSLSLSTLLISRSRDEAVAARKQVEERNRQNRRMLAASDTRSALEAYQRGDLDVSREFLERQMPKEGEEDMRDFAWRWLNAAIASHCPEVASFDDHPSEVYKVAYSPDGDLLASACDRLIVIHDLQNGSRDEIAAHASRVTSIDFSPDGALLASVGDDHHVRLWDVKTRRLAADLGEHECQTTAVDFSPDGSRLVSGDDVGWARIWDVARRCEEKRLKGHNRKIDAAAFAAEDTLITDGGDSQVIGWDPDAGQPRWQFGAPFTPLMSMAISPDGTTIVGGDHSGTVGLWNVSDGQELGMLGRRSTMIQGVAFSHDNKLVAAGGHDGVAQIWDLASGHFCGRTSEHGDRVWSVAFSPDGRTLATGSRDRTVKIWDLASGRRPSRLSFDRGGRQLAFSSSGDLAMLGDGRFWTLQKSAAAPTAHFATPANTGSALTFLQGRLLTTAANRDLVVFDASGNSENWAQRDGSDIDSLNVSSDGRWLAVNTGAGGHIIAELWNVRDKVLRFSRRDCHPMEFTSDSKYALFRYDDRLMRLQLDDIAAGELELVRASHVLSYAVSPDDRLVAFGRFDAAIELVDLTTRERKRMTGHERAVLALAFSPDGQTLASGGADSTLRLWRVDVAEPMGVLDRRTCGSIRQLAFSPDGTRLAAAGEVGSGGMVSVWGIDSE